MKRSTILALLAVVWTGCYGWSIAALWVIEPTGDGFTRGMNRLTTFLGWQMVAVVPAIMLFSMRKRAGRPLRFVLWIPLGLALALVLLILGLLMWSWITHWMHPPAAPVPPGPVTAPAPKAGP